MTGKEVTWPKNRRVEFRIEESRWNRCREAYERRKARNPDLAFTDWVREALDRQATRELEQEGWPTPKL